MVVSFLDFLRDLVVFAATVCCRWHGGGGDIDESFATLSRGALIVR